MPRHRHLAVDGGHRRDAHPHQGGPGRGQGVRRRSCPPRINVGLVHVQRQRLAHGVAHHRPRRGHAGHRQPAARRAHRHRRGHLHLPRRHSSSCPTAKGTQVPGPHRADDRRHHHRRPAERAWPPPPRPRSQGAGVDHRLRHRRTARSRIPQEPHADPGARSTRRPSRTSPRPPAASFYTAASESELKQRLPEHRQLGRLRHRAARRSSTWFIGRPALAACSLLSQPPAVLSLPLVPARLALMQRRSGVTARRRSAPAADLLADDAGASRRAAW